MMKYTARAGFLLVLLMGASGCASVKVENYSPEKKASNECSSETFQKIASTAIPNQPSYLEVLSQQGILKTSETDQYLNSIASPLRTYWKQTTFPPIYTTPYLTPSAYAGHDGGIYISMGSLLSAESEDEIAGILAHEMGHVACGHVENQRLPTLVQAGASVMDLGVLAVQLPTAMLTGLGQDKNGNLQVLTYGSYQEKGMSREQEKLADILAVDALVASQYNEMGYINGLMRTAADDQGREDETVFSGTAHPMTDTRVNLITGYTEKVYPNRNPPDLQTSRLKSWKKSVQSLVKKLETLTEVRNILINPFAIAGGSPKRPADSVKKAAAKMHSVFGDDSTVFNRLAMGTYTSKNPQTQALAQMFMTRWMAAELEAFTGRNPKTFSKAVDTLINSPDAPIGFYAFTAVQYLKSGHYEEGMGALNYGINKFKDHHEALCDIVPVANAHAQKHGIAKFRGVCPISDAHHGFSESAKKKAKEKMASCGNSNTGVTPTASGGTRIDLNAIVKESVKCVKEEIDQTELFELDAFAEYYEQNSF